MTETEREGETALEPLIKMHSVIQILIFLHNTSIANTWVLSTCVRGVYFAKNIFFLLDIIWGSLSIFIFFIFFVIESVRLMACVV